MGRVSLLVFDSHLGEINASGWSRWTVPQIEVHYFWESKDCQWKHKKKNNKNFVPLKLLKEVLKVYFGMHFKININTEV